jgi:hypothetical protein
MVSPFVNFDVVVVTSYGDYKGNLRIGNSSLYMVTNEGKIIPQSDFKEVVLRELHNEPEYRWVV